MPGSTTSRLAGSFHSVISVPASTLPNAVGLVDLSVMKPRLSATPSCPQSSGGTPAIIGSNNRPVMTLGETSAYTFEVYYRTVTARIKVCQEFATEHRAQRTAGFFTIASPLNTSR